ncbi:MAG: hypothetical protein WCJ39_10445 [bacterium]
MKGKKVCDQHSKDLEVFCSECKGLNEPMCSICMCEHVKVSHGIKGPTHIIIKIEEGLKQIEANRVNIEALQEKIKNYDNEAQEKQVENIQSKDKLDKKLAKLKNFFTIQETLASSSHANILRCHDSTYKEIRKCETKIKDNQKDKEKYEKKVREMLKDKRYWEGYEEVQLGLVETKKLDDEEIKGKLIEYQKLMEDYKNILTTLNKTPDNFSDYSQLNEENADLKSNL